MQLQVKNESGKRSVDWWFMYKFPKGLNPIKSRSRSFKKTTGNEYLYFQSGQHGPLSFSKYRLDKQKGSLYHTLDQIYNVGKKDADSLGWICYNDEIPRKKSNNAEKGHTKGMIAFDLKSNTSFWLSHSWPKFVDIPTRKLGSADYGQTFICIQLKDVQTARTIAEQLFSRNEAQTYQVRLPKGISKTELFYRLANEVNVHNTDPPSDINFFSKKGQLFRMIAKNRYWDKDFWIDLVGPHLEMDIDVETWRRGTVPGTEDADNIHTTSDVLYINTEYLGAPYEWHYTKDHSKWGITDKADWVCVADINRQTSQEKRGGGAICFQNKALWLSLKSLEKLK